ncbi:MAG: glutamate--tRNA ligase [Gammaproteobacteria bacterium]|nr:glutamate--tRNA ligase [Gammaproteobacteria bacterium]MBT6754851.1 glutamate--tRNA ligase [Gammaproteobacteria bacterium]MBT7523371.1 glutamate--tRNA ligase [Gammaproteobacteria bacterium]MBT7814289.1 glutamate--tRNA ligase [Gammaproteobacteria bacterium]MDC3386046.1 glutamate--tRNA ligase [Gammaproteobacteria bacterium]
MMVITRFAPSPTGNLHIGGARTALFNWLYAKNQGGKFLLRIEDTDKARSEAKYVESILESLDWLGINHDDSLIYQSDRVDKYKEAINNLLESGNAYYCNCSKEDLDKLRSEQQKLGLKPKYDGRNRDKSLEKSADTVVRFKTPLDGEITLNDTLKGPVTVNNKELDDLIIQRADGSPTYNLTVVVDDVEMGITNVIRGDDHLNNTYRQVHMMKALGYKTPTYTHIPLIMGEDRKRLSKRHGATSTYDFRSEGILPISIINYLARLGWAEGDKEKFTLEELVNLFNLKGLNKSASIFDYKKLYSFNKYFIKELEIHDLYKEFMHLTDDFKDFSEVKVIEIIEAQRDRCKTIKEIIEESQFFLSDIFDIDKKLASKFFIKNNESIFDRLSENLSNVEEWTLINVKEVIDTVMHALELDLPNFAKPTRLALTGSLSSPSIDITIYLLGKESCIKRFSAAKILIT